jgi:hypothetical protein
MTTAVSLAPQFLLRANTSISQYILRYVIIIIINYVIYRYKCVTGFVKADIKVCNIQKTIADNFIWETLLNENYFPPIILPSQDMT